MASTTVLNVIRPSMYASSPSPYSNAPSRGCRHVQLLTPRAASLRGHTSHSVASRARRERAKNGPVGRSVRARGTRGHREVKATASLTQDQIDFYHSEGYLVIEDFATKEECSQLRERAEEIIDDFDPKTVSIFSTTDQESTADNYFLDSANNVSCFFEEKAFDDDRNLKQAKSKSINKIGHAMHDLDPVFAPFSRSEKLGEVAKSLGYVTPTPVQSMYIFKQPMIGGEVVPHQDSTFLYTDPPSVCGAWFALEDATIENGCLWILPKSHTGDITRRMRLTDTRAISFDGQIPEFDLSTFVPVEVKEGSLVMLHGAVWHMSHENTSPKSRHAYSIHFVESSGAAWDDQNWLQRKAEIPFKPFGAEAKAKAEAPAPDLAVPPMRKVGAGN
mmetsp:Transcript_29697/g.64845  ORF Transcript_29697/g.64845 Transcript_29697/m.64845 type:complete len:389 (-) Transcript_29697:234-1400(-)